MRSVALVDSFDLILLTSLNLGMFGREEMRESRTSLIGRYENISLLLACVFDVHFVSPQSRRVKQAMMKERYDEGPVKAGHFGFELTDIIVHPLSPSPEQGNSR
jgi:hypothetical protein